MTITRTMNSRLIHSVILMLLLSLTVHEAHSAVIHEFETCDVCIHIQSNDDSTLNYQSQYILLDVAFQIKIKAHTHDLIPTIQTTVEFIRGPPTFSYFFI